MSNKPDKINFDFDKKIFYRFTSFGPDIIQDEAINYFYEIIENNIVDTLIKNSILNILLLTRTIEPMYYVDIYKHDKKILLDIFKNLNSTHIDSMIENLYKYAIMAMEQKNKIEKKNLETNDSLTQIYNSIYNIKNIPIDKFQNTMNNEILIHGGSTKY